MGPDADRCSLMVTDTWDQDATGQTGGRGVRLTEREDGSTRNDSAMTEGERDSQLQGGETTERTKKVGKEKEGGPFWMALQAQLVRMGALGGGQVM